MEVIEICIMPSNRVHPSWVSHVSPLPELRTYPNGCSTKNGSAVETCLEPLLEMGELWNCVSTTPKNGESHEIICRQHPKRELDHIVCLLFRKYEKVIKLCVDRPQNQNSSQTETNVNARKLSIQYVHTHPRHVPHTTLHTFVQTLHLVCTYSHTRNSR